MREWNGSQKQKNSNLRKLLQERTEETNPHRTLTSEEGKRLAKFETIAAKLKCGENTLSRQL